MGYHMAGFDVRGIDIEPQPNYPFKFRRQDALTLSPKWIRKHFDVVVASAPCLGYTTLAARYPHIHHDKLIPATRDLLAATGLPYIIENVQNARKELIEPITLCGSSFGLRVRRHRLFESNVPLPTAPTCNHQWQDRDKRYFTRLSKVRGTSYPTGTVQVYGGSQHWQPAEFELPTHRGYNMHIASVAMGIDWMNQLELNQAIPPVYTYWLGRQLHKWLLQ